MSNEAVSGVSVKEYAAQRGKTIQAVYQQMKRKENAAALKGHVLLQRVGNKNVKYLDEEAVAILDRSSNSAPLVILEEGLKDSLALAQQETKQWEAQAFKLQGQVELLKEMLEQRDEALRLLDEPQRRIEGLEAQNGILSAERDEWKGKATQFENEAQKASNELTAALTREEEKDKRIQELENRTFGDYLKGLFRKK